MLINRLSYSSRVGGETPLTASITNCKVAAHIDRLAHLPVTN